MTSDNSGLARARDLSGRYVIAGIGHTAFGKLPGRSTFSLHIEAARAAIADAGISKDLVDGLLVKYPTSRFQSMYSYRLAEAMGIFPRVSGVLDQAGAANVSLIASATQSIELGQADVVIVSFADTPRSNGEPQDRPLDPFSAPFGWVGPAASYAMLAQAYLGRYGLDRDALMGVPLNARANGARNPHAQLRKPLVPEEYAAEPFVVGPLRRDDCALVSDGAAAVVVMSAERARGLEVPDAVPILGYGQAHVSWDIAQRPDLLFNLAGSSAESAFAMAGITRDDVDVIEFYDCFSIVPLLTLEAYGWCGPGQAADFVNAGGVAPDGEIPMNTSGGLLSETGMPGMQHVLEGVRQIRGTSSTQVDGASIAVISNQGGILTTHSTLVLGRS